MEKKVSTSAKDDVAVDYAANVKKVIAELPEVNEKRIPSTQDLDKPLTAKDQRTSESLLLLDKEIPVEIAPVFFVVKPGEREPLATRCKVFRGLSELKSRDDWFLVEIVLEIEWTGKKVPVLRHFSKLIIEDLKGGEKLPIWRAFHNNAVHLGWKNSSVKTDFLSYIFKQTEAK